MYIYSGYVIAIVPFSYEDNHYQVACNARVVIYAQKVQVLFLDNRGFEKYQSQLTPQGTYMHLVIIGTATRVY